ncbi:MAG: thioesterase family protein [Acidobacteriia bacterium]|nr:thioesterase family protein [Terriglobia bacterium]
MTPSGPPAASNASTTHREWVRPRQPLPDDSTIQMAALVFLSDFYSHWTASGQRGHLCAPSISSGESRTLGPPTRTMGWLVLLKAVSNVGSAGRLFNRRELYSVKGALLASAAQEGFYSGESP